MPFDESRPATRETEFRRSPRSVRPRVLEICAGAGGQALGLEQAGFWHAALIENDRWACETLRANRPRWKVHEADVRVVSGQEFVGVDLLAGGVPCPPFSMAGRQAERMMTGTSSRR